MKVRPDGSQEYSAEEQLAKVKLGQIELDAPLRKERNRRLARYDEAVSIVRRYYVECMRQGILFGAINGDAEAFLAAEPKEGDMETRPTGIPHYLRDSRLRSNGMREAAEIVRNFRPASACTCGSYISFHNGVPGHQPGCLVGECLEVADEIDARADEIDETIRA